MIVLELGEWYDNLLIFKKKHDCPGTWRQYRMLPVQLKVFVLFLTPLTLASVTMLARMMLVHVATKYFYGAALSIMIVQQ